jgi:hypothetical protein
VHERGGEIEPALHPAGVALHAAVGGVDELDQLDQLDGAGGRVAARQAEQLSLQDERLAPGLARVEPRLLQRDAHPAARRVGLAGDVHTGHVRGPRGDREQRREHLDHGGLARAVWPEEPEDLAVLDPQVDAAHRLDHPRPAAVVLDQRLGLHRRGRARSRVVHVPAPRSDLCAHPE